MIRDTPCARVRALLWLGVLAALGGCTALPEAPRTIAAPLHLEAVSVPIARPTLSYSVATPAAASDDLWQQLRTGFALPRIEHPRIVAERRWYAGHQDYMDRVVARARSYLPWIAEQIEARGMPTEIALLPIVESAFDPYAYSHGTAAGLWQFIPATGRRYGLDQDWWHDERRDVLESTRAALDHLQDLQREFDGDWLLALAAYNSGPGNVRRALRRNRARGAGLGFFELDLPRETEAYVPKLLALRDLVLDPAASGLELAPLPVAPGFEVVDVGSQIDLARAARLAAIDIETLYRLNPGLNRWATHPEGPHRLLVPPGAGDRLREGLASLPPEQRIAWYRHRIRPGETLSTIADRYGLSVQSLRTANRLRGSVIRAGDALLIPVATAAADQYALSSDGRQARREERAAASGAREERYRVRSGDSFWLIARRYGVGTRQLADWNGMAVRDPLQVGQELVLWLPAAADPALAMAPPEREQVTRRVGYRVRRGDSLSRIASRFGVTVDEIARWNTLDASRYLQPGQRLTLFVDVTGGP